MRVHEPWITAVFVLYILTGISNALRGSELVLAAKAKAAEEKQNPTTEEITVVINEDGTNSTVVKPKPLLTGIPQKDYIYDPNLPRELKGHNLTNYPFYNAVPEDIDFVCDGLHDGFYASVPHHCQLYHHCLFGTRYDFLCANYTAFDQKTFICHFVSEVDCDNSPKYYNRNEALYKQATTPPPPSTTTTRATTTTTTTTVATPRKSGAGGRRRRPSYRRRRPVYEYYYDDEDYDDEYYDDEEDLPPPRKQAGRRHHQRPQGGRRDEHGSATTTTTTTTTTTASPAPLPADAPLTRAPLSVYAPKVLPKIKRPVPINEKSKYDYTTKPGTNIVKPTKHPRKVHDDDDGGDEEEFDDDDYYDEDYEDVPPPPPPKKKESGKNGRRRSHQQERKRPSRYDDDYEDEEEEEEERPRMRKGHRRGSMEDDYRPRSRGGGSGKGRKGGYRGGDDDFDPIPSERPGYISGRGGNSRKRYQEERPKKNDRWRSQEYDYDDDDDDEDKEAASRYDEERRRPPPPRAKVEKMRPRSITKKTTTTPAPTTTTTTTTTTARTTPAKEVEEEDYEEEYEDVEEPVSEEIKPKYRNNSGPKSSTTLGPHRFSTTNYKHSKQDVQTTTEAITRQKTQPVTYRRSKPELRRPTTKSPTEPFVSSVGTPAGFKKPDADVKLKKSEPVLVSRRPYSSSSEDTSSSGGRQVKNEEAINSREIRKPEKMIPVVEEDGLDYKQSEEEMNIPVQGRPVEESTNVRRPYYSGEPSQQDIKADPDDTDPSRKPSKTEYPVSGFERRPDDSYRKQQRPAVYSPTAPDTAPIVQVYRRPFVASPNDNSRRPAEDTGVSVRRPLKQDGFVSVPTSVDNGFKRPSFNSATGEGQARRPEEQQSRRTVKPDQVEGARRPSTDGMPITAAGYRRGVRPNDKDKKKTLEELAYPSRGRNKENPTTQDPLVDRGPNYRNPFSISRPVKEEDQEYFKPPKTVEFTAPGPSGEGSTHRPFPVYDIDEEYDVTLNDALQPSTLNPTLQFSRVKSRGYQSAVTHPSYHSLLIPSASQTFYSKTPVHNADEYETVVLPAARFTQARFKQRRPADWYW